MESIKNAEVVSVMYTKICSRCGKRFTTWTDKAKYCSAACRQSSFKERTRSDARAEKEAGQQAQDRKWKRQAVARTRQRRQEVEAAAKSGDPFSRMITAKRFSPEYFAALADYEDQYARESGQSSSCTINGISINDPDFAESAAYAVKTDGVFVMGH